MQALNEISHYLHNLCLDMSPNSEYRELYQAIVCGSDIKNKEFQGLFQNSGLLHLIIVSGSHLIFLSEILTKIRISNPFFHGLILLPYLFICRLQAPAVRSFFAFVLQSLSQKYRFNLSPFYLHLFSIVFCLLLFPHWFQSLSLMLSALASLGLSLSKKHTGQCILIYFFILPLLTFTHISPLSLLNNILISPLVGILLFPMNLFSFMVPYLTSISDYLWWLLLETLTLQENLFSFSKGQIFNKKHHYLIQWIYLCTCLMLLRKKRF